MSDRPETTAVEVVHAALADMLPRAYAGADRRAAKAALQALQAWLRDQGEDGGAALIRESCYD